MSLREAKRKDPVWVSAGSLWQDSSVLEMTASNGGSGKQLVSPRSRTRALSVAYIVSEDASVPQTEENLSLKCLKEACADAHASFRTISFDKISVGTTDILDSFYNAGKCRDGVWRGILGYYADQFNLPSLVNLPADVAVVEMSDSFCQQSLFYHLGVRESFSMTNNIILYCYKENSDLQALKVTCVYVIVRNLCKTLTSAAIMLEYKTAGSQTRHPKTLYAEHDDSIIVNVGAGKCIQCDLQEAPLL